MGVGKIYCASMNSFYLTLPSNSSMSFSPNNTPTNYVTKLQQPISLSEDGQVGLIEVIFPTVFPALHPSWGTLTYTILNPASREKPASVKVESVNMSTIHLGCLP